MDILSKWKSTVSTTVSQLSGVLPGNPVTREYEVGKHIGSAGPDLLWKIYSGFKKTTKQEAAIFVLEKKLLDKYQKKDKDYLLDVFRRGVAQLTRLRHPQVLTVQHALEESRESLAFATEPVFASLANILGAHENLPSPLPHQLKDYQLLDLEIKYGLQQITEGLIFLHNDAKLLHGNLCPESIIVNEQGAWKISGFDFCITTQNPQDGKTWPVKMPDPELPPAAQPNLDYLAPELGLGKRYGGNVNTIDCGASADMYALGCIIISIYQKGEIPWKMNGDVESFYRLATSFPVHPRLDGIPTDLVDHVRTLVQCSQAQRLDAHQFVKISFFDDVGVKTLNYLDSLFQWDNLQKSQFYKGLPQILPRLPHRVCLYRVMPCLAKEFVNPPMIPFILPCALLIAQEASKESFVSHILPFLKPVMKIQEPIQILLIFMQKMELLLQKTPADDVKSDVLPMVYRALDAEASSQIQELCLTVIPNFASLIDYPAMKNALMPRIKKLCLNSSHLSVRVNCLLCIGKLLDHVDKWLVLDDILPMLSSIPSKDPAVIMGILGIYKLSLENPRLGIPKEVIATQIVPFLFPLSVEPGLSLSQFRSLMAMIKDMLHRVEEEQKSKLQNVAALQEEQRSSLHSTLSSIPVNNNQSSKPSNTGVAQADTSCPQISTAFVVESANSKPFVAPSNTSLGQMNPNSMTRSAPLTTTTPTLLPQQSTSIANARPATCWNNGKSNIDPFSSLVQSNLSAMTSAPTPTSKPIINQWPSGLQGNAAWNPVQQQQQQQHQQQPAVPSQMRFPTMVPHVQFPMNTQPVMPMIASPPAVRPLALADIDDLLS